MIRTGFGYDVHPLVTGRSLVIGGCLIPHHKGADGHSDADVLIHALIDALLGAAALRDTGYHFPDHDPLYKNADSRQLLITCMRLIRAKGYELGNVDATVCLEQPRLSDYIPEMQKVLAETMDVETGQVGIKATTTERLGFVGREEGIAAYAVALLVKSSS